MSLLPEPPRQNPVTSTARSNNVGLLLVNLGTPDAPTTAAVRRYLKEFLSDTRVVEIPSLLWWPILNGIILNTRPRQSAKKYASVWMPEGSPLKVHTDRQARLLSEHLAATLSVPVQVAPAMRYGNPSIDATLAELKAAGCDRILVLPMYPQYASSTTGAVFDVVADRIKRSRNLPELRLVRGFHDDAGYVGALAASIREHWDQHGRGDRLVMSFHGLPRYTVERGDPYFDECQATARHLADALGLAADQWQITFQSRFGRTEWLQPYTSVTLAELARQGVGRIDIACPGFPADCLETLEEIGMEAREDFIAAGGRELRVIPCLNERPDWIAALGSLARRHLGDWVASR